jgi:hypothetical protein
MLVFCHCPKTAGTSLFRAISMIHGLQHSYLAKRERPSVAAHGALHSSPAMSPTNSTPNKPMQRARMGYNSLHLSETPSN